MQIKCIWRKGAEIFKFGANSWKIEKLKYNFIRINILYQNQIPFPKVPHKLPAEEDLFMSGQCLPKQ